VGSHKFDFDKIFPPFSSQKAIYDYAAKPVVDDLFKGYNGTIFVYGQTGSGKTHTMQGPDIHDEEMKGIIPRIIETVFMGVEEAEEKLEFLVKVSYIEIYMEKIRDLLNPAKTDLKIRENRDKSVYIENVTESYVASQADVIKLMEYGQTNRKVSSTKMNDVSSRSHSVFVLTVEQKDTSTGSTMSGVLYLVDLAGSEKVAKTGASGQTLDEAKGINKSLSALGNVINALTDGKSKHVPYRDSKLTRILQQSLGGNSRTTLVINCSPSSFNEEETISTLRFGMRAKTIKNAAKVNKEMSVAELKELLDKAKQEIGRLKAYISGLEDEVRQYRGDSPMRPPTGQKSQLASPLPPKLSLDTREKLPNVAKIQDRCNELEEKLKSEEEEKLAILEKLDAITDQLRDKENELESSLARVEKLKEQLNNASATAEEFEKENSIMVSKIAEMTIAEQKFEYERKEMQLNVESLMEEKDELSQLVEKLQKESVELADLKNKYEESSHKSSHDAKKSKLDDLARQQFAMLEGVDQLRKSVEEDVSRMEQMGSSIHHPEAGAQDAKYKNRIAELEKQLAEAQQANKQLALEKEQTLHRIEKVSPREPPVPKPTQPTTPKPVDDLAGLGLDTLNIDIEGGNVGDVAPVTVGGGEVVESFEMELLRAEMNDIRDELKASREENAKLKSQLENMPSNVGDKDVNWEKAKEEEWAVQNEEKRLKLEQELNELRGKTATKLAEFDGLKTSLLRDLQNRCEKVIDLEMLLDEAREQYEQLLKKSSNKSLQKRNMFLERNLEQLTRVHQQLVNQNNALRLEKKVSEKKLAARNERIRGLEVLLQSAQEKLQQQAEAHSSGIAKYKQLVEDLKLKLEKAQQHRQRSGSTNANAANPGHARIAKPLRGGGGRKKTSPPESPTTPTRDPKPVIRKSSSAANGDSPATSTPGTPDPKQQSGGLFSIFRGKSPTDSNGKDEAQSSPYKPPKNT